MSTEKRNCHFCSGENYTSLWTLNNGRAISIYAHERCIEDDNLRRDKTKGKWRYVEYSPEMIGTEWRFCGAITSIAKLNDGSQHKNYCGARAQFELLYEKNVKGWNQPIAFRKPVCADCRTISRNIKVVRLKNGWEG